MQEITVDIIPGIGAPAKCYASQNDHLRSVKINLTNNGEKYELTGQELLTLRMEKSTGETVTAEMENPGGSQLIAVFSDAMTDTPGNNTGSIHIFVNEHKKFITGLFTLLIEQKP